MGEIAEALKKANAERGLKPDEPVKTPAPAAPAAAPIARELPAPPPRPASETRSSYAPPPPAPGGLASIVAAAASAVPEPPVESELLQTEYGQDQLDLHRHLALRVRSELERLNIRGVSIVSALRNEGKTTVACNLAMALASISPDRDVALIDLDLRNPSVARRFGFEPQAGVEEVILGGAELSSIRLSLEHPALDVYPAHEPQRAAHELLVDTHFADMLRELQTRYSVVVVDTPPTLLVPDSTLILRHVGACIAVADLGMTRVRRFKEMLELLPEHQLIGKILNGTAPPKHQQDYYYAYGEGEGKGESRDDSK